MALPLKGQCHQVLKIIFFMKEPTPYTNVTVRSRILRWITYVTQERLFVLGDSAESNFFFFIFFSLQHAEAYRVLLHYFYSITVWSAASQTTLWGGPIPRFEPGTTSLEAGTLTFRPPHFIVFFYRVSLRNWGQRLFFSSYWKTYQWLYCIRSVILRENEITCNTVLIRRR